MQSGMQTCVNPYTMLPDCSTHPSLCNEVSECHQHSVGIRQAIEDDQHDAPYHTSNTAAITWPLHQLHVSIGPGVDKHAPHKGCTSTHGTCCRSPTWHKLCELCDHCEAMPHSTSGVGCHLTPPGLNHVPCGAYMALWPPTRAPTRVTLPV